MVVYFNPGPRTIYEYAQTKKVAESKLPLREFYETKYVEFFNEQGKHSAGAFECEIELAWYDLGCPQYKIYPDILQPLSRSTIDIPANELKLPFSVFTIRFPVGLMRENDDSPAVRGVMVLIRKLSAGTTAEEYETAPLVDKLVMRTDFEGDALQAMQTLFTLHEGKTIAECFEMMPNREQPPGDTGYWPSDEFVGRLLRVAVGTAFIGIAKEREVQGDDENKVELLHEEGPNTAERLKLEKMGKRGGKIAAGYRGFAVGRDIKLPKASPRPHGESAEGTGERLDYGHWRAAHLRRQHFGPSNSLLKVIFILPTRVRKELPLKPKLTERAIQLPD